MALGGVVVGLAGDDLFEALDVAVDVAVEVVLHEEDEMVSRSLGFFVERTTHVGLLAASGFEGVAGHAPSGSGEVAVGVGEGSQAGRGEDGESGLHLDQKIEKDGGVGVE